ncbi:MAG: hypothetical protein AB7O52_09090 [Planctomycetota bacterium]
MVPILTRDVYGVLARARQFASADHLRNAVRQTFLEVLRDFQTTGTPAPLPFRKPLTIERRSAPSQPRA